MAAKAEQVSAGAESASAGGERRPLIIAKGWVQATLLVFVFGFFVLVLLAFRNYGGEPPVPGSVVDENGEVLFTAKDVHDGQKVFLDNGLMEYGTVFGHGAYLGPDFTADYLHRAAGVVADETGGTRDDTTAHFKRNTYDERTKTLVFSAAQAEAFRVNEAHYRRFFADPSTRRGLRPSPITDRAEIHDMTAFFAWTAWAASARRPGKDYSYTNNWPPEERVGNSPSGSAVVWSALSLLALLGGIGALMAAFGRWRLLGWHEREGHVLRFRAAEDVALTPAQRACAFLFFVMAALFLLQVLAGGLIQHYRADPGSFYGIDMAKLVPFNLARTWHVQLAIFWVATSYLASGIFITPLVSHHEPKGQSWLTYGLLGALAIVVFGSLAGARAPHHRGGGGDKASEGHHGVE